MVNKSEHEWVLPSAIPFEDLKGKDLETCIYWLLDAMGAKDLEWRTGGGGGGAADGGRDLEARFYTPSIDDEVEAKTWWIECKGRQSTVEADAVKQAVNNAMARADLEYLVIATNTQFSNPTLDWVKDWQKTRPRPRIKMWDHAHLEKLLSKHPDVVLRLFSSALSLQGRFKAMETKLLNRVEFIPPNSLIEFWNSRESLDISPFGIFAAICNEFSHGDINRRSWGVWIDGSLLLETLYSAVSNLTYLRERCHSGGIDDYPICRAVSYVVLCALNTLDVSTVANIVDYALYRGKSSDIPENIRNFLWMPIADQILGEIQEVCSNSCVRVSIIADPSLSKKAEDLADYWLRLEVDKLEKKSNGSLILQKRDAPCIVGFSVDRDIGCPLFEFESTFDNLVEFLTMIQRVTRFRFNEARAEVLRDAESRAKPPIEWDEFLKG